MTPIGFIAFCLGFILALVQGEDGHCVWYGECGDSPYTKGPVNCVYSGQAKPFKTSKAYDQLKEFCPDLYQGPNTPTCCSDGQMERLVEEMTVPIQLLGHCPECLHNFLNIFCQLTCSANQSQFLSVVETTQWTNPVTRQIDMQALEVDYALTPAFAKGMYDSCEKVRIPMADVPAISVLCGRLPSDCTPSNLLSYIGDIHNGQAPFQINFNITSTPFVDKLGHHIVPASAKTAPCIPRYPLNKFPCTCGMPWPKPPFDKYFPTVYRTEQLVIGRRGQHPKVKHETFPSPYTIFFSALFDKEFLHQVLQFQETVSSLHAPYKDRIIGLEDACFKLNDQNCTVLSLLGYYQNNANILDRKVMDQWGFFVLADYLDHFLHCVRIPTLPDDTPYFHAPCLGPDGGPVYPWTILQDYDGTNYQNATALVITYVFDYPDDDEGQRAKVKALEDEMKSYVQYVASTSPNMTVTLSSETHHHHPPPPSSQPLVG